MPSRSSRIRFLKVKFEGACEPALWGRSFCSQRCPELATTVQQRLTGRSQMSQIVVQIVGDPGTIHGACCDCQSNQTVCSWGKLQCDLGVTEPERCSCSSYSRPGAGQVTVWGLKSHSFFRVCALSFVSVCYGFGLIPQSLCAHFPSSHWE